MKQLEPQPQILKVNDVTKALLEQAQTSAQKGETAILEQSSINFRKRS